MTAIITNETGTTDATEPTVKPVATIGPEALALLEQRRLKFVNGGGLEVLDVVRLRETYAGREDQIPTGALRDEEVLINPIPNTAARNHSDMLARALDKYEPRLKGYQSKLRAMRWAAAKELVTQVIDGLSEYQLTLADLLGDRTWKLSAITTGMKPTEPKEGGQNGSAVKRPSLESFEKAVDSAVQKWQEAQPLIDRRDALEAERAAFWMDHEYMLSSPERVHFDALSRPINRLSASHFLDRVERNLGESKKLVQSLQQTGGPGRGSGRRGNEKSRQEGRERNARLLAEKRVKK